MRIPLAGGQYSSAKVEMPSSCRVLAPPAQRKTGRAVVGGVISPGNAPGALTVGAVNTRATAARSDDLMATYSSRGPSAFDGVLKPDVVAPGNKIVAPASPGSYLSRTYPERIVSGQGSTAAPMAGIPSS